MDTINEKTTAIVTLTFTDEDGSPVTPDSGSYWIDDIASGTAIKTETALAASGTTEDVTISATENAILNSDLAYEDHRMTVEITYNTTKKCTDQYDFRIINLSRIS